MSDETSTQWTFATKGAGHLRPEGRRSFTVLMVFLGIVFVLAVAASIYEGWQLRREALGDGRTVESYGFDLSNLNVSRESFVPAGMLRDEQPVLNDPAVLTLAEVDEQSDYPLWPVVHDDEAVIGVVFEGEARAYPVRIMRGHEIVNDTVGGQPIAVTYSPLSDSAAVFDRQVEGAVLDFGYSGLLSDSNLVMYDRGTESLWSQLRMRAIAGPMARESASDAARLEVLPMWFGRWADWRAMQPQTTVLEAMREHRRSYVADPWERYYAEGDLRYPVDRLAEDDRPLMQPIIVEGGEGEGWQVREAEMQDRDEPLRPIVRARWFAWHAARDE